MRLRITYAIAGILIGLLIGLGVWYFVFRLAMIICFDCDPSPYYFPAAGILGLLLGMLVWVLTIRLGYQFGKRREGVPLANPVSGAQVTGTSTRLMSSQVIVGGVLGLIVGVPIAIFVTHSVFAMVASVAYIEYDPQGSYYYALLLWMAVIVLGGWVGKKIERYKGPFAGSSVGDSSHSKEVGIVLSVLIGILLILGAGYYLYQKKNNALMAQYQKQSEAYDKKFAQSVKTGDALYRLKQGTFTYKERADKTGFDASVAIRGERAGAYTLVLFYPGIGEDLPPVYVHSQSVTITPETSRLNMFIRYQYIADAYRANKVSKIPVVLDMAHVSLYAQLEPIFDEEEKATMEFIPSPTTQQIGLPLHMQITADKYIILPPSTSAAWGSEHNYGRIFPQ